MASKAKSNKYKPPLVRSQTELTEFYLCQNNFLYFIMKHVKIVTVENGTIPFKMFAFQIAALKAIHENKYTISLKPRQMGMSTLLAAYLLWLAMFKREQNILIISLKFSVGKSFLRKMKAMYRKLPEYLKMEILNGEGGQDRAGTTESIQFANGSEVSVSASTPDAGRSEALSFLLIDEVAFQKNASEIWGAAQQTLATGGKACMISTAYGMGNLFHETWTKAVQGLNGFFPIRLHWKMHPHRNQKWYDEQLLAMGPKRTAQEIDCDFLKSGYNVFDLSNIREIEERVLESKAIEVHEDGQLLVYKLPDPKKYYVIGADVATGRSRDYSAFSIMDMDGVEHACFKGKMSINAFGKLLLKWGYRYNMATLAPEVNSIGEGVIAVLQENYYPNIYVETKKVKKKGQKEPEEQEIYGWYTTTKSRDVIITGMDDDLMNATCELCNPFFVQEGYTFIYNEQNKPIALGKQLKKGSGQGDMYSDENAVTYVDDSIMAGCIANEVRKRLNRYRGALPFSGGA